jgi:hypothetical protein
MKINPLKWFTDRINIQIWNDTLKSSNCIIDENHARELYHNQKNKFYKYRDRHVQPRKTNK